MGQWQKLGMRLNLQKNCKESKCLCEDLVVSNTDPHNRVATKKSGPTINRFLKKIQQQMGVAVVGFAAYRNEAGKLCTFEYVISSSQELIQLTKIQLLYSFCTEDSSKNTFSQAHSQDIEQFLGKWGKWVSQKGTV